MVERKPTSRRLYQCDRLAFKNWCDPEGLLRARLSLQRPLVSFVATASWSQVSSAVECTLLGQACGGRGSWCLGVRRAETEGRAISLQRMTTSLGTSFRALTLRLHRVRLNRINGDRGDNFDVARFRVTDRRVVPNCFESVMDGLGGVWVFG